MDFYEVIQRRRSYRFYKPGLMPNKDKIEKILNAARLAPTWQNKQGVEYIIVKTPETVKKIWKAIQQGKKFAEAPMFIIAIIAESGSGFNINGEKYYGVDLGICFEHLILAATAEGLATCWVGFFNETKIKKILDIPEKYKVMALTPLGYPIREKREVHDRKFLEEIIHYEKY